MDIVYQKNEVDLSDWQCFKYSILKYSRGTLLGWAVSYYLSTVDMMECYPRVSLLISLIDMVKIIFIYGYGYQKAYVWLLGLLFQRTVQTWQNLENTFKRELYCRDIGIYTVCNAFIYSM